MKRTSLVVVALGSAGCSKKSKYEKLCGRLEEQACSETVLGFSAADRMTLVVGQLSEESSAYQELFDSVVKLPAAERKKAITDKVSEVTGEPWACAAFDALWDANEDYCLEKSKKK
jgi:hypothetical protein